MSAFGHLFRGAARILSGELLAIPCLLLILSVLTRVLGPAEYGQYALAAAIVNWLEWSLNTIFGRATIKLVAESRDWHKPAGSVVQLHFITALLVTAVLILLSKILAGIFHEPSLAGYLKLFALDIPCWSAAQAYRGILIARESFSKRSWLSITRWVGRVVFTIPLVFFYPSVEAAICGWILSSVLEVVVARILISIPLGYGLLRVTARKLFAYAAPLSVFGLIMRLYDKSDLFVLKILGASAQQAGVYSAAQNFSVGVGLLTMSFSIPLLGTLTRLTSEESHIEAGKVVASTFRGVLFLIPFLAFISASAPEIVDLIFGKRFIETGPILRILLFSALSMLVVSVNTSILIAIGRQLVPLYLSLPMLPLAFTGYFLFIPAYGPKGAAFATLIVSALLATVSTIVVHSIRPIRLKPLTLIRSVLIALLAWWVGETWHSEKLFLLLKLSACAIMVSALFVFTGEVGKSDVEFVKKFLIRKKEPDSVSM